MAARATRRGVEVPLDSPLAPRARRELLVSPLSLNDPFPKRFRVYLETPHALVVPHHWARQHGGITPGRVPGKPIDVTFSGALRDDLRQPEAVAAVRRSWDECGGAMLCLPVGFGKTQSALWLIAAVKRKTVVLVHKTFLKDQWVERIRMCLPGARIGEIQGDTCTDGDIIIAMIQTLLSRKTPAVLGDVHLVVCDECHHVAAPAFSQAMWGLNAPLTLGLTATPRRRDGLQRVMEWFLGPIAFHVRRENQDTTEVEVVRYACPEFEGPPPTNRRGDVCFATMITRLVENPARSRRIADLVARLVHAGRHVLVLSHRRAHCFELVELLKPLVDGDCGSYVGGDKACPDTRVVVATYALTSEGFDLPRLNALVLATPASDVEQSCGRVMRGSSTRGAWIVDVFDQWGPCHAMAAKRRGFYKRSGFSVRGAAPEAPAEPPRDFAFVDD